MTLPAAMRDQIAEDTFSKLPPGFWDGPREPEVPEAYKAVTKAKLSRDRQSYKAFRAVDEDLHVRAHLARADAAVARVKAKLAEDQALTDEMAAEAAEALVIARRAEDHAIKATEHARKCREESDALRTGDDPEAATEALVRLDKAIQVATEAERTYDAARAEADDLQEAIAEARDDLAKLRLTLAAANAAVSASPGVAPISDATIRANASYMQSDEVWQTLSGSDKQRVSHFVKPRAVTTLAQMLGV